MANTGLYIKFGQGLVAMNHILPKEYTETLSILQDQALRRESENELENIFIEDLGKRPDELFRKFNPVPIAAARSAQLPIFGFYLISLYGLDMLARFLRSALVKFSCRILGLFLFVLFLKLCQKLGFGKIPGMNE